MGDIKFNIFRIIMNTEDTHIFTYRHHDDQMTSWILKLDISVNITKQKKFRFSFTFLVYKIYIWVWIEREGNTSIFAPKP